MSYQPKTYRAQGGDEFVVASGGKITVESGGELRSGPAAAGTTTADLAAGGVSLVVGGATATGANVYTIDAPVPGQPKWISCSLANSSDVARIKGETTGITFGPSTAATPFLNLTTSITVQLVVYTTAIYHVVGAPSTVGHGYTLSS
jgi:hypothetical protein